MATIVPDVTAAVSSILPIARQFEAASFRAWPAASVAYDGAWVTRLTPGHPSKRLNSVNFLDPGDARDIAARVADVSRRFAEAGARPAFRITPLSPPELDAYLEAEGWRAEAGSIVMRARLDDLPLADAIDQIPLKDIGRFVEAASGIRNVRDARWKAQVKVIEAIPAEAGLFVAEADGVSVASTICVHEGVLAGLFDLVTAEHLRGQGHGRRLVLSALKWARMRGARQGWLQVEEANKPAVSLYEKLGFAEIYRYRYRLKPE